MGRKIVFIILFFACLRVAGAQEGRMDLSGIWRFQLDPMGFGKTPGSELYEAKLAESIILPGSTDQGGKGIRTTARYVDRLTRTFEYCGQAWYQREVVIPEDWKDKEIFLHLERCHWETTVYVDGRFAASDERLSTPNRFQLTQWLTPGVHTLTLCIDNRLKYPMDQWNHGTTEYTQTNWNGVAGTMELVAREKTYIGRLHVYPDLQNTSVGLNLTLHNTTGAPVSGKLNVSVRGQNGKTVRTAVFPVTVPDREIEWKEKIDLGKTVRLWDEFTPELYGLDVTFETDGKSDTRNLCFGMREVEQGTHHIRLNGRDIHLRGTLDCAVFPLTGYPSTRVDDWKRILRTVKSYGMNHVRFHSWCPPKAAFTAADEVGIYLQAELPMWIKDVGKYPERRDFFEKEMYALLDEYGNHPSFILMCNGNENEGNFDVLEDLVNKARQYDSRRLYSASTARTHTKSDQYYVSHVTSKGGITVYEGQPSTMWDKRKESDIDVPVIAHESGQRCMYPDFGEIRKYTGVVEPRNFEVFQERLARNGMLHQARDFFRSTGAHTVLQYKEVNESLLRTPNSGGFQLLGLSDFPGQGSAFVGILDAFWESKGLVSPEKFRESCAPTVLLARVPRRVYMNDETFRVGLEIYHYGQFPLKRGKLAWQLVNESGKVYRKGVLSTPRIACATVDSLGTVEFALDTVSSPEKLAFQVVLDDSVRNEWNIWVYPREEKVGKTDFVYVRKYDQQVKQALEQGMSVLLVPDKVAGRKARFAGHFWNPVMFNWNPLIVGTLVDSRHPAFGSFPTDMYADWQWWDILNYATAVDLTGFTDLTPVIQSIDSYENNRKLGIAFEARVGKGRLFVLCIDPEKDIANRNATRQLLRSVGKYVASPDVFVPACELTGYELDALFDDVPDRQEKEQESAAVKQLLNQ